MKIKLKPLTKEEWRRKADQLAVVQEENWKKHFKRHKEQLLPDAEIRRRVPLAEYDLLADLLSLRNVSSSDYE